MNPVEIRSATSSDTPEITRLARELGYSTNSESIRSMLEKLVLNPAHYIALAEQDGIAHGFIAAEHRLVLESGEWVEIVGLVVTARSRQLGIGRMLVDAVENWAADRGVESVRVRSNVTRMESHVFYERIGYARQKTQHVYVKRIVA